ncbi:MAG: alpha/beta fold hydrolase [Longimicrobiales bacterium]|nr:alpha/beta fold hydrolase [Longimicrobiales bacterium]
MRVGRAWGALLMGVLVLLGGVACADGDSPSTAVESPGLESFQLRSDGHPLTVWARIPPQPRQVVLLLHGRTWSILPDFDLRTQGQPSLMEYLADEGVAVYGLDARGYGGTPRDETGWLEPDRMAQDARSVLSWLRERHPEAAPPVVLGWSYGSAIAHLTAQRWPELVSGVSLYGYFKNPATRLSVTESPAEPPRAATTREAALSDFITPGTIDSADIEAFVATALEADPVRVDIRNGDQLNALSPDSLLVPTQILQGELDPIAPTPVQAALFQELGTAHKEWIVLPGCDHAAHIEVCKRRFESAFLRFVREVG